MRCPKCGYISFDHLETCRKCKKNIMNASMEINGTVYNVISPSFLQIEIDDAPDDSDNWEGTLAETSAGGMENEAALFAKDAFAHGENVSTLASEEDLENVDLGEVLRADSGEFAETAEDRNDDSSDEPPPMDFGDLDISDLAPPEQAESPKKQNPALAMSEGVSQGGGAKKRQEKKTKSVGLADLQLEGLDLDSPPRTLTGASAGKRNLADVKTGTALDNFDIDLGSLFEDKKESEKK